MDRTSPIGFFDSGLGGISVLRGTLRLLPGEDYLYFGDSFHAPYGVRPVEEVQCLSRAAVDHLLERGAIQKIVGRRPEILDGSDGIARQLKRRLEELDLLNPRAKDGCVTFENSLEGPEMLELSEMLLRYQDE